MPKKFIPFNTKDSLNKVAETAAFYGDTPSTVSIAPFDSKIDRVNKIRQGIPYAAIENLSLRLNRPVKRVLEFIKLPQTTYNKKKSENAQMGSRDSELIILVNELLDFGLEVFNHEESKFQNWLIKPNYSLGGYTPESLLDTITGLEEVRSCLYRIEYGIFA